MPPAIVTSRMRNQRSLPVQGPYYPNLSNWQSVGLAAWWPLGDSGLVSLYDYSPNASKNNLALTGTLGRSPTGYGGSGFANSGSTANYLDVQSAIVLRPYTMLCMFNVASIVTSYDLFWLANNSGTSNYEGIILNDAGNGLVSALSSTGTEVSSASPNAYTANTPNQAVAIFASSTSRIGGLNGQLGTVQATSRAPTLVRVSVGALHVGTSVFGPINGTIWDVRLYNYAMTAGQVAEVYANWRDLYYQPGRVAYDKFAASAPAGGTTYSVSVSEGSTAAVDTVTDRATFGCTVTETGAAGDSVTVVAIFGSSVSEAGAATDTVSTAVTWGVAVTESGAAADTVSTHATFGGQVTEAGAATDSNAAAQVFAVAVGEVGAGSDNCGCTTQFGCNVSEAGAATDAPLTAATFGCAVTESGNATDSMTAGAAYSLTISESGTATDSTSSSALWACAVAEVGGANDSPAAAAVFTALLSEAATGLDAVTAAGVFNTTLTESAAALDTTTSTTVISLSLSESGAATDAVTVRATFTTSLTEAGAAAETLTTTVLFYEVVVESGAALDTVALVGLSLPTGGVWFEVDRPTAWREAGRSLAWTSEDRATAWTGGVMTAANLLTKRVNEVRSYSMRFDEFTEIEDSGDTIASVTSVVAAVANGTGTVPTLGTAAIDATSTKVSLTVSGGEAGTTYSITFTVVTTAGMTLEAVGSLRVIA